MLIRSIDQPQVEPLSLPDRFRMEVVYFMTPGDAPGVPKLGPKEYWIKRQEAQQWLDDGAVSIVSPLDAASKAEMELTDYQEAWLEWMVEHSIQHIRLESQ